MPSAPVLQLPKLRFEPANDWQKGHVTNLPSNGGYYSPAQDAGQLQNNADTYAYRIITEFFR